jgi:serine/threonine protein kinase
MPHRHKVGEGGFGCVHKPSLHCAKGKMNIDYNKYISKLMKKKSAKKELNDFVIVSKVDPDNKYHLGTPIICTPDVDNDDTIRDINECKRFTAHEVRESPNKYKLLLLKDGGNDLSIFCKHHLKHFINKNPNNVYKFWLEARHLIQGIHFFNSHGIVHYDLKPQNIVFNSDTFKLMFIDFGLMNTKVHIKRDAKRSSLKSANFHWSYPFDNGFLNKEYFTYYKNLSPELKQLFKDRFAQYLFTDKTPPTSSNSNSIELYIRKPHAFNLIFDYIYLHKNEEMKYEDVALFFTTFDQFISENSYETTIDKTINSLDIYGLGFTLKYVLNHFFMANAISKEFYDMFSPLFERMYSFDFFQRMDNTKQVLEQYDEILEKSGIRDILDEKGSFSNTSLNKNTNTNTSILFGDKPNFGVQQFRSNYIATPLDLFAYEDAHTNSLTSSKKTRRRKGKSKGGKKKSIKYYIKTKT